MSSIQPSQLRFSGYQLLKNGHAQVFLPGHADAKVTADMFSQTDEYTKPLHMEWQDGYWVSSALVPPGDYYRIKIGDPQPTIDATATTGPQQSTPVEFKKPDQAKAPYWDAMLPAAAATYQVPTQQFPNMRVEKWLFDSAHPSEPKPVRYLGAVPLRREGAHWVFSTDGKTPAQPNHTYGYRLTYGLDCLEVAQPTQDLNAGTFNRVARNGLTGPQKAGPIIDIFQDSIVPSSELEALDQQARAAKKRPPSQMGQAAAAQQLPVLPMANHFTRYASRPGGSREQGLTELLPHLENAGFSGILFKPFIGGDTISSHGYWTVDPYVLNNTFQSKDSFREFLVGSMGRGMKVYADGAFVNQGLNGVQMMSNLAHRFNSPYWRWMKYGDEQQPGGPPQFPSMAHGQYVFGVLPTTKNPQTGERTLDYNRFAFRVINDPAKTEYDTKRPTFIELYDPLQETEEGKPKPEHEELRDGQSSVHSLRFPVSVKELKQKQAALRRAGDTAQSKAARQLFTTWSNFRLDEPSADDSGVKWDGQAGVALLNMKNPEVVSYINDALGYWTRMVTNTQTKAITEAMVRQARAMQLPELHNMLKFQHLIQLEHALQLNSPIPNLSEFLAGDRISRSDAQRQLKASDAYRALEAAEQQLEPELLPEWKQLLTKDFSTEPDRCSEDLMALIDQVTRRNSPGYDKDKLLPPMINPEAEALTFSDIQALLSHLHSETTDPGKAFVERLLKEVPLNVLPLPVLFKATLSYPKLQDALQGPERSPFANFIDQRILAPLAETAIIGGFFNTVREFLFPPPFMQAFSEKMNRVFSKLPKQAQHKLNYGNMQSQVADQVGELLYLSLLTGLDINAVRDLMTPETLKKNPHALEDAFYKGMPGNILKADPDTASKLLPSLLRQRLRALQEQPVADQIKNVLRDLDPTLAAVAQAMVEKRELGLNWRIDAAKDVGDLDRVYEAEPEERTGVFQQVIQDIQEFWMEMTGTIRKHNSKAAILAELTDFNKLCNTDPQEADAALRQLQGSRTFTGAPNMNYLYSGLLQLVNYAQRPDEYGDRQLTPGQFADRIQEMLETTPASAMQQAQNLTSSHDYATTSHAMLINPELFTMDLQKYWGLKDDFRVAVDELRTKPCFAAARQKLWEAIGPTAQAQGMQTLDAFLDTLVHGVSRLDAKQFPPFSRVPLFLDEDSKKSSYRTLTATPHELKGRFLDELCDFKPGYDGKGHGAPERVGLTTQDELNALREALRPRMTEPSETKAMRGAIVNAELALGQDEQTQQALWQALDRAASKWGRHLGYQPLDVALRHVFDEMRPEELPLAMQSLKNQEQWKTALFNQAMQPVMGNLLKVFALQNALPGNPSVYLPDLFAQGGGEWTKNIFCQNRNLIQVNKLQDPDFQKFFQQVGNIFTTRSNPELQVLNNGVVLPVTPDDQNGVVSIVRDNGQQQAITLVNVGKPKPLGLGHRAGLDAHYPNAARDVQQKLESYQPDLSELHLPKGTRYYNFHRPEQEFVLNAEGKLVDAYDPHLGVDLADWCLLVRKPLPAKEPGNTSEDWSLFQVNTPQRTSYG